MPQRENRFPQKLNLFHFLHPNIEGNSSIRLRFLARECNVLMRNRRLKIERPPWENIYAKNLISWTPHIPWQLLWFAPFFLDRKRSLPPLLSLALFRRFGMLFSLDFLNSIGRSSQGPAGVPRNREKIATFDPKKRVEFDEILGFLWENVAFVSSADCNSSVRAGWSPR